MNTEIKEIRTGNVPSEWTVCDDYALRATVGDEIEVTTWEIGIERKIKTKISGFYLRRFSVIYLFIDPETGEEREATGDEIQLLIA